jgi:hypothetical protein
MSFGTRSRSATELVNPKFAGCWKMCTTLRNYWTQVIELLCYFLRVCVCVCIYICIYINIYVCVCVCYQIARPAGT